MPRLCALDGMIIWVNSRDHFRPHFHARYSGDEVRVDLRTITVTTGRLPPARQRLLLRWAAAHKRELVRNWYPAQRGPPHEPIAADADEFAKVSIDPDLGVLCWPNGADIDAELLRYDDLWVKTVGLAQTA